VSRHNEKVSGSESAIKLIQILIKMGALTLKVFSDELIENGITEGEYRPNEARRT
jgi:hypothetical protein